MRLDHFCCIPCTVGSDQWAAIHPQLLLSLTASLVACQCLSCNQCELLLPDDNGMSDAGECHPPIALRIKWLLHTSLDLDVIGSQSSTIVNKTLEMWSKI